MKIQIIAIGLIFSILLAGCSSQENNIDKKQTQNIKDLEIVNAKTEDIEFYKYFKLDQLKIQSNAPQ